MKIKVCGMRELENVNELIRLNIDYMGFIFYDKSPRYTRSIPEVKFPEHIKKTGVFVNESIENVQRVGCKDRFARKFLQVTRCFGHRFSIIEITALDKITTKLFALKDDC